MKKHRCLRPSLALLALAMSPAFLHAKPALPDERLREQAMLLPDGDHLLLTFNVPVFFKSKTFALLHARSAQASELLGLALEKHVGVSTNNIDLIRLGLTNQHNGNVRPMTVVVVKKPVTLDHIKTNVGARTEEWTTVKAAGRTVHYVLGNDPNPAQGLLPFCIDGKLVLTGTLKAITKTLQRKSPASLTVAMRQAVKEAGSAHMLSIVVDVQRLLSEEAENNKVPLPGGLDGIKELRLIVIKVNEAGNRIKATATFLSNDAASADKLQKSIEMLRPMLNQAGVNDDTKALAAIADTLKLNRVDNRIEASVSVESGVVAALLQKGFAPAK
jgi:hypothetical protein